MIENVTAIAGIESILRKIDDVDLFSLAATVTQGFLKDTLQNRKDAIEAIIKYSQSAQSFLRRKMITRELLFKYAHEVNMNVTMPITKDKLIGMILIYWEDQYDDCRIPMNEENRQSNHIKVVQEQEPGNQQMQVLTDETDLMAEKFSEWFYGMMNGNSCIGTEHFFEDANLKIHLINGNQIQTDEVAANVEEIVRLLYKTKSDYRLYFNPNINRDGTRGRSEPHGLVLIMCCGTLHIDNIVTGVFEQTFALARDPFSDNNWKIKNTELKLTSKSNVNAMPTLNDTEMSSKLRINN
ncbi:PREDICTED: uncharacterized protein C3orf38 homolog [Nicrophorus vespilloides]|uniref:Uncharacterized protein C3orf38 homolog n=1 Tax=Nicrophorus vespilloides TaxID=110193 RepID=A0ABM1N2R5_NICVS|nr:PREDICTED: uncharacterized protein C3orf38 homolog [Nicrophorus vespilloides]